MPELNISFGLLVGLVMALTEVVKQVVGLGTRFKPLVAILFGLAFSLGLYGITPGTILYGILIGVTAAGVYSGGKAVIKG